VTLRYRGKAKMRVGMVSPTNAELIQGPVIVGAKSFKEAVNKRLAGIRTVGKLMPVKMIEAGGDEHVFEDVEWRGQSLDEVIEKIVIGVGAVMKQGAESCLPFLRLQNAVGIRLVPEKAFKVVLSDRTSLRPGRDLEVDKIGDQVSALDEAHLGIEVGLDNRPQSLRLNEVAVVGDVCRCRPV